MGTVRRNLHFHAGSIYLLRDPTKAELVALDVLRGAVIQVAGRLPFSSVYSSLPKEACSFLLFPHNPCDIYGLAHAFLVGGQALDGVVDDVPVAGRTLPAVNPERAKLVPVATERSGVV